LNVKTYAFAPSPSESGGGLAGAFASALSREKRCFSYRTCRYGAARGADSVKLYKVYEVRQIRDFADSFREIEDWLRGFGLAEEIERLARYRRWARAEGTLLYPVLCALDVSRAEGLQPAGYFSIR
jgi:hypothetical protein